MSIPPLGENLMPIGTSLSLIFIWIDLSLCNSALKWKSDPHRDSLSLKVVLIWSSFDGVEIRTPSRHFNVPHFVLTNNFPKLFKVLTSNSFQTCKLIKIRNSTLRNTNSGKYERFDQNLENLSLENLIFKLRINLIAINKSEDALVNSKNGVFNAISGLFSEYKVLGHPWKWLI